MAWYIMETPRIEEVFLWIASLHYWQDGCMLCTCPGSKEAALQLDVRHRISGWDRDQTDRV